MTRDEIQSTLLALPAVERRELAEVLWRSLEVDPEPLPDWQRRLLDERMAVLEAQPDEGAEWDDVERRVWADAKR